MNRRTFLQTSSVGAAGALIPGPAKHVGPITPTFVGYWPETWETENPSRCLVFINPTTAAFENPEHEGPIFKFTRDWRPRAGDLVRINVNYDMCRDRGNSRHRPSTGHRRSCFSWV